MFSPDIKEGDLVHYRRQLKDNRELYGTVSNVGKTAMTVRTPDGAEVVVTDRDLVRKA